MNNVKTYNDKQLLDYCESLSSFNGFPTDYWILGVQSNEDTYNVFDDKFYLFKGREFITVAPGTTNSGSTSMNGFEKYNKEGVAVIKTNEWYYNLWSFGLHRGKMEALRQVSDILFYRDNNKNKKIEETGRLYKGKIGINFHTMTYKVAWGLIKKYIGGWSAGCQVVNDYNKYRKILELTKWQDYVSYCLIKEF